MMLHVYVCRDALMIKLMSIGITGPVFNCIEHMYRNSKTQLKMAKKLSDSIDVLIGTEQGHTMSPEFFKLFINDLSSKLNDIPGANVPHLNGFPISHLLWADDLIILALDRETLQHQLNCLNEYVTEWELKVNISKTNVMVFNSASRILQCAHGFQLGEELINPIRKYTYLGIQFSLNGSFKSTIDELRKKALRAFYTIKRTVDTRAMPVSILTKLVNSLIKPVATYSCPVWLPSTALMKHYIQDGSASISSVVSKDPLESCHLKILKWILGVHKKTSNNACYGDTGDFPWLIQNIPQCVRYFNRAVSLDADQNSTNILLYHAVQEQMNLDLTWYKSWNEFLARCTNNNTTAPANRKQLESVVGSHYQTRFVEQWYDSVNTQKKLAFYRDNKYNFGYEPYLDISNRKDRVNITKLRFSAHDLNIELGRYSQNTGSLTTRCCRYCCNMSRLSLLEELPFFDTPIMETEEHVITECPGYHGLRSQLSEHLLSLIMLKRYDLIMSCHAAEFGRYLSKCHQNRQEPMTVLC